MRKNRGWFRRGHDPRRHVFTREDCSRGYYAALFGGPSVEVAQWVYTKVKGYYRGRPRERKGG